MSRVIRRRWPGNPDAPSRRGREACDYSAYVPDLLTGRHIAFDGDVAADLADAESAIRRLDADRAGTEGIKLTSAGYLPPADVEALAAELNLADEWIGKLNREAQTPPILDYRESVMRLGLLRKYQGALLPTPAARKLRDNPAALWWHIAEHLPPKLPRPHTYASILLLAAVAIGSKAAP